MFPPTLAFVLGAVLTSASPQCAQRPATITQRQLAVQIRCAKTPDDYLRLANFSREQAAHFDGLANDTEKSLQSRDDNACRCGKHSTSEHERVLLDYYRSQARYMARSAEKFQQLATGTGR